MYIGLLTDACIASSSGVDMHMARSSSRVRNNNDDDNDNDNNNNTNSGGSVLTGEELPPHSGELSHGLSQAGAQSNPGYPALCRRDTTSPWSTDYKGNNYS